MKTTPFLSLRPFALLAAACLLTGLAAATPVLAAPGVSPEKAAAAPDPHNTETKALLAELAARVREKSLFAAQTSPKLAESLREADSQHRDGGMDVLDSLWDLRVAPDIQARWIAWLSDPKQAETQLYDIVHEFEIYMMEANHLAEDMAHHKTENLWTKINRYLPAPSREDSGSWRQLPLEETRRKLKNVKIREKTFAEALVVLEALNAAWVDPYSAKQYTYQLRNLVGKPDDLALAASLFTREMDLKRLAALLEKLASDPEPARKEIADLHEKWALHDRYVYAVHEEREHGYIMLPAESLLPGINKAMGKRGTVALAAHPVTRPDKSLRFAKLERLVPDGAALEPGLDGSLPALPFLLPGEQLYLIAERGETGFPVFAGTPLERLVKVGPRVIPFTPETAQHIAMAITSGMNENFLDTTTILAAECGPEELAAHLGSLSVIYGSREKRLYGPYNDFVHRPGAMDKNMGGVRLESGYPKDIPGDAYRLANTADGEFFLALAPQADENGLKRLMGPIRGVWVRNNAPGIPEPLREMRYTPKTGRVRMYALGASPVLSLDRENLNALIEAALEKMINAQASFTLFSASKDDATPDKEYWNETLKQTVEKYNAIRAKGFISPIDIAVAAHYLRIHADDPGMTEKLRAILDDRTMSSAKRVKAMRDVITKEEK